MECPDRELDINLMNGKEKHEVFDWSNIFSMSQSEFVTSLETTYAFCVFFNITNSYVTSVSFFLFFCDISLEE